MRWVLPKLPSKLKVARWRHSKAAARAKSLGVRRKGLWSSLNSAIMLSSCAAVGAASAFGVDDFSSFFSDCPVSVTMRQGFSAALLGVVVSVRSPYWMPFLSWTGIGREFMTAAVNWPLVGQLITAFSHGWRSVFDINVVQPRRRASPHGISPLLTAGACTAILVIELG